MHFFTQILLCLNFLLLVHLSFSAIVDDKFTFLKTISKKEEGNIYRQFSVPYKRNHILTCSATCLVNEECIGIDICEERICRLCNATFYPSISLNNSNELCYRYIKVRIFHALFKTLKYMFFLYTSYLIICTSSVMFSIFAQI